MHFPTYDILPHEFANGLTAIIDSHHEHPVVSVQIWVETGSIHEGDMAGAGLSHFLEHMVFKGTEKYDGERLAEIVQAAGGHWNAYTTFDHTVYHIDGPAEGLAIFLDVLAEMVFRPNLSLEDFDLEKDVIRREIDMGNDDPSQRSTQLLLRSAFRTDARRLPIIGERELFDRITHHDLTDYHRRRYTPERCFFIISGDVEKSLVIEHIDSLTKNTPRGFAKEEFLPSDSPSATNLRAAETFPTASSKLTISWKIPPHGHPDTRAYELLAAILGAGQSSILYQYIREKLHLAHEIAAWTWTTHRAEGLFAISAECEPGKSSELEMQIHQLLSEANPQLWQDDLTKAIAQVSVSQLRPLTSAAGRAADIGSNWFAFRNPDYTSHYVQSLRAVTTADLTRCLNHLLASHHITTELKPESIASVSSNKIEKSAAQIHTHTTAYGLRCVLLPDHRVPLISIQCAILGGLPTENSQICGINQLTSACIKHGTTSRSSAEIARAIESRGASLQAQAGNNSLIISATCLAHDLTEILNIFADVLINPIFPADCVAREKASLLAHIHEASLDPLDTAFRTMRAALFSNKTYGLPLIGTVESVSALTNENLANHYRALLTTKNLSLAISGSFDAEKITAQIEQQFSALPTHDVVSTEISEYHTGSRNGELLEKNQAVIAIGYPAFSVSDPRRYALQLLHHYCADMSGPLFTRLREELGLAYQVSATSFTGIDSGMFAAYIATSPEQQDFAEKELLSELGKIADEGIPAERFPHVRSSVLAAHSLAAQGLGSTARAAALNVLLGLPADHHRDIPNILHAISIEEVKQCAAHILNQAPTIQIITPSEQKKSQIV